MICSIVDSARAPLTFRRQMNPQILHAVLQADDVELQRLRQNLICYTCGSPKTHVLVEQVLNHRGVKPSVQAHGFTTATTTPINEPNATNAYPATTAVTAENNGHPFGSGSKQASMLPGIGPCPNML